MTNSTEVEIPLAEKKPARLYFYCEPCGKQTWLALDPPSGEPTCDKCGTPFERPVVGAPSTAVFVPAPYGKQP